VEMSDLKDNEIIEVDISEEAKNAKENSNYETQYFKGKETKKEVKGKHSHHKKQVKADEIIKKLEEENGELKNRLLRRLAEFENYKKRVYQEKENFVKEKLGKFIFDLLNILDNFDRALNHISEDEKNSSLYQGITLIDKQVHDLLEKYGVKEMDTSNNIFDPFYHQALDKEEVEENLDKPMISQVFQKGYMFNNSVLRPALVKVKIKKENSDYSNNQEADGENNCNTDLNKSN
jgi:molecular chaperone GrpE